MKNYYQGNTLTEYGIIIGLVVVLSVAALTMLGKSTTKVISDGTATLKSKEVGNMMTLNFGGGTSLAARKLVIDPASGLPAIQIMDSSGSGVNTTSTEGMTVSAQTLSTAAQLQEQVLPQITDPATLGWAKEVTELVYYMGGTEGSYEGIPQLDITNGSGMGIHPQSNYTQAAALTDLYGYQDKLLDKLKNPPAKADKAQVAQVTEMAMDAWNHAQGYISKLDPYIDSDGRIDTSDLAKSKLNEGQRKLTTVSYDDIVKLDVLQDNTETVLATGAATGTPTVQSTLETATQLNTTTSGTTP